MRTQAVAYPGRWPGLSCGCPFGTQGNGTTDNWQLPKRLQFTGPRGYQERADLLRKLRPEMADLAVVLAVGIVPIAGFG